MRNDESRPPTEARPDNTIANAIQPSSRPRQVVGSVDEGWVVRQRLAIRLAAESRVTFWLSPHLRIPCHDDDLVIARDIASVDRALRESRELVA